MEAAEGPVRVKVWAADGGRVALYRADLWRGVSVWLNEVRLGVLPAQPDEGRCVKVNYCLEGRCEMRLEQEGYFYQFEGQVSVSSGRTQDFYSYPTRRYDGVEVFLDLDAIDPGVRDVVESLGFSCAEKDATLAAVPSLETRALLKDLARSLRAGGGTLARYRLAVLRLLHAVAAEGVSPIGRQCFLTPGQREVARRAEAELTADLARRVTVEQLAARLRVSPSSLKKYFTMLYGSTVTAYMQQRRCEEAARLLRETGLKVGQVAERVGYANQGKFGEVFRRAMGCAPLEYRRRVGARGGGSADGPADGPAQCQSEQ